MCRIFNNVCVCNIKKVAQENLHILFTKLNRGRIIANKMIAVVSLLCAVSKSRQIFSAFSDRKAKAAKISSELPATVVQ